MSDDELLHALRNSKGWPTLGNAAADRIEQLEAELAEARMQALSALGQAQEAYEAQKKAEAERDAAHKRGMEDAAEIADELRRLAIAVHAKHYPEVTNWQVSDDIGTVVLQIDNMVAGMVRAQIQERGDEET